jgi:rRNA maturation RNase YbeY
LSIRIFYDETKFRLKVWRKTRQIINSIIGEENKRAGNINFIITNDKTLRKINVQFLEHDYNTDVIAFNYTDVDIINGEIYLSLETIKRNSINYNVSLKMEILRVMIHGVLHLVGYDDKSEEESIQMRRMEERWLSLFIEKSDGI